MSRRLVTMRWSCASAQILPVRPIERYRPVFDEHGLPEAEAPPQDTTAWEQALREILSNRVLYEEESRISRERALAFVASVRPEQMEELLTALPKAAPQAGGGEALSPEKRALLLQRFRKKTGG